MEVGCLKYPGASIIGSQPKMAGRTQHEGKTERAKESHGGCSQPPSMCVLKTADLGTQAILVVNSFKLHLTAYKFPTGIGT